MIYEDEEKPEKSPHINYKEYKKKLDANPNENLILFVSAFFVMLLLFLGVVKQLSPDVDVAIGSNDDTTVEEVEKGNVDDRLKAIQMEDNSYKAEDNTFSPELEEKVRIPKQNPKTVGEMEKEAEVIVLDSHKHGETVSTPVQPNTTSTAPVPTVTAKVVVGYYATAEQAEVAKGIIQDAGLNIQPFVKHIGGAYTLQVGSFSSREKAQSVANELLRNNFPARVLVE